MRCGMFDSAALYTRLSIRHPPMREKPGQIKRKSNLFQLEGIDATASAEDAAVPGGEVHPEERVSNG